MRSAAVLAILLTLPLLAGCLAPASPDDSVGPAMSGGSTADASWARPLPESVAGMEPVARADIPSGAGIWVFGDYVYSSGLETGFHITDIHDPANPVHVGSIEGEFFSRDVDWLGQIGERSYVVAAGEGGGMHFIDVTDPATPQVVSTLTLEGSTHNLAVLPGTTLVYNSASDGAGGKIEVVDASDPAVPVKAGTFGTHGCHDITFFLAEGKQRLYCAGIEETQIWDIQDPLAGVLVSSFTNAFISAGGAALGSNGALTPGLHHLAMTNADGTLLIVGDEYTGGLGPGCGAHAAGRSGPLGALWFYDITGDKENDPVLLGWFAPTAPVQEYAAGVSAASSPFAVVFGLGCTAHFGALIPGHEMLVMGWYRAGVVLVDFKDPAAPVQVDQWNQGTNTWDVKYANGYLFTGDMDRGLDVLTFR